MQTITVSIDTLVLAIGTLSHTAINLRQADPQLSARLIAAAAELRRAITEHDDFESGGQPIYATVSEHVM